MKTPKFISKAAVAIGLKEPPRRRGLGRKNPIRIAQESVSMQNPERSLVPVPMSVAKARVLPNGKLLQSVRAYKEVASVGGVNSDWAVNALSEDSDIWQNIFLLRQRSRDLFRTDVYFQKYTEELWANVFGFNGYSMRLNIKETEDRVVYASAEKAFREGYLRRRERVREWMSQRSLVARHPSVSNGSRQSATVQMGDFDLYAIDLIERAWKEWQRREYCTAAGRLNYKEVRHVRLLSAARDGDFFIRHIRDPKINKFGYSQQLINSEWCDFYLNTTLRNGNEIRMGIERDKWGRPLNYYFIKRQPMDWQYSIPGAFNYSSAEGHEIIPASEIIHYARYRDGDSTRPAPWSASVIPKSRHLDKYEEAEVVSARVAACKMGFFQSTLIPEGGTIVGEQPDPTKAATLEAEPGSFQGLPWGVEAREFNPTHPSQNFPAFRKEMLRAWCAGMPGANYNIIGNDLEGVNYSSGRLGMLDERELWKLIQDFDIDVAEVPTFEAFLEMALMTGAIPLPMAKFDKFNKPVIRGRRWAWVDPLKEVQASAMQVANKFTSRTRVIEDSDVDADFEEILLEQAEEEMMAEELGMDLTPVVGKASPQQQWNPEEEELPANDANSDRAKALTITDKKDTNVLQLIELMRAVSAPAQPAVTVNVPEIKVPPPTVNISELKVPEQKAPIVHFNPELKSPEVVVNVAPPDVKIAPPVVNVAAPAVTVNMPKSKGAKIKRGNDGKMEALELEFE